MSETCDFVDNPACGAKILQPIIIRMAALVFGAARRGSEGGCNQVLFLGCRY